MFEMDKERPFIITYEGKRYYNFTFTVRVNRSGAVGGLYFDKSITDWYCKLESEGEVIFDGVFVGEWLLPEKHYDVLMIRESS